MTWADLSAVAWWTAVTFLGVQVVVALVNAMSFPVLRRGPRRRGRSLRPVPRRTRRDVVVSLLVPARNEEANLPITVPTWLAQGADEVIVLNDGSTDATADLLRTWSATSDVLEVVDGKPLPAGWMGKPWACHQLAGRARGDVWIFTDADVRWHDGALEALVDDMLARDVGLATVWPRQLLGTWFERIAVPQIDVILLGALPHPLVAATPFAALAGANGQAMAWTPQAYRAAGGHSFVRDEVLEDVRMAQAAKAAGVRLGLFLGGDAISTRMYTSGPQVVEGFAKNVVAAAGSTLGLAALVGLNVVAYLVPVVAWAWSPAWWLPLTLAWLLRAIVDTKVGRGPYAAVLQSASVVALLRIVAAVWRTRGVVTWSGRTYADGTGR